MINKNQINYITLQITRKYCKILTYQFSKNPIFTVYDDIYETNRLSKVSV